MRKPSFGGNKITRSTQLARRLPERGPMAFRVSRLAVVPGLVLFAACSDDQVAGRVGQIEEALSSNDRILNFEGSVGGAGSDWRAMVGTATSSTTHSEGTHALALGGNTNPEAASAALSALGTLSGPPTVDIELPAGYQNQGSYYGQCTLAVTCASSNINNQQLGTVQLAAPTGSFRTYAFPALPTAVATALRNTNGCTVDLRLNLSNSGGKAVFVDRLSFGQTTGSGGSGGTGGMGGVGGTAGVGATGGAGAGGKSGAGGVAGQGGAGAAGKAGTGAGGAGAAGKAGAGGAGAGGQGGAGTGGAAGGTSVEFFTEVPSSADRKTVAVATTGGALTLDDGFVVLNGSAGFASVSSVRTTALSTLGVATEVQNLWSQADVFLRNAAHVHGNVTTQGVVQAPQGFYTIDGTKLEHAALDPVQHQAWSVVFPFTNQGPITLEPSTTRTALPGAYGSVSVKQGATLTLGGSAGIYTFDGTFGVEPGGILDIDNSGGNVQLHVRGAFTFRGQITPRDLSKNNVLIAVASTAPISITPPFRGILVAPYADVALESGVGHYGSVFAHSVTAHQHSDYHFLPFDPKNFCGSTAACNGLCPCSAPSACDDDGDCAAGFACGIGQGPRFGKATGSNACWPRHCASDAGTTSCGTILSECGTCDVPVRSCQSNADCAASEACTPNNGGYFGAPGDSVCWPQVCTTAARTSNCGGQNAPCGQCDCSCSGKTCGGDMSNGCGGQCEHLCGNRQGGCTTDAHCPAGSICLLGGGPRVGLAQGTNVCLPTVCGNFDLAKVPCGSLASTCGLCPACTPQCDGKCGGASDQCGGTCTGSCPSGQSCSTSGSCIGDPFVPVDGIPNGLGGTTTVTPLDPGPTAGVGALPGMFGVTDSGKASYRIPIVSAPGRLGVEPKLALTYGGTIRNGLLGAGWYLEGLSTVARCRHTSNEDDFAAQIADDTSDRFCLDGVLLLAEPGQTNGGDGVVHHPEFDPGTRVIPYGSESGPSWFKVWRSNGLIYTYGSTTDSSVYANVDTQAKREWALNRVEDHVGNYLTVEYTNPPAPADDPGDRGTREIRPVRIRYTGFDGAGAPPLVPDRVIVLSYQDDRPDSTYGFAYHGHTVVRQQRLSVVTSYLGSSNVVRQYRIKYGDEVDVGEPAPTMLSRIAYITECDSTVCKPATHFEYYNDGAAPFGQAVDAGITLHTDYQDAVGFIGILDADGDGRDDILYQYYYAQDVTSQFDWATTETLHNVTSPRYRLLSAQGSRSTPFVDRAVGPYLGTSFWLCGKVPSDGHWSQFTPNSIVDWDLDGKDDLFDFWGGDRSKFRAILGPDFTQALQVSSGPSLAPGCGDAPPTQLQDATGDGFPDIVYQDATFARIYPRNPLAPTTLGSQLRISGTELFVGNPPDSNFQAAWMDYDGDGAPEIVTTPKTFVVVPQAQTPFGPGLAAFDATQVVHVRPDFASASLVVTNTDKFLNTGGLGLVPIADMNGDGLKDTVTVGADPLGGLSSVFVGLNSDSNTVRGATTHIPGFVWDNLNFGAFGDFNHDGKEDLLVPSAIHGTQDAVHPALANIWNLYSLEKGELKVVATANTSTAGNTIIPFGSHMRYGRMTGDFDGDGNIDLLVTQGNAMRVVYGQGFASNLLKAVTDGVGKRIEVKYAAGAPSGGAAGVYAAGQTCYPLRCNRRTGPLVSEHTEAQTTHTEGGTPRLERRFSYSYSDGRTNPADQRFVGFGQRVIKAFDGAGNSLNTTTITLDNSTRVGAGTYPLAGKHTLVSVAEPQTHSDLTPSVNTSRATTTEYDWSVKTSTTGQLYPALDVKETTVSEVVTSSSGLPLTLDVRPVQSTREEYTNDLKFNNITNVLRIERTGTTEVFRSNVSIPLRQDAGFLNDWLINLPQQRIVTDTVRPAGASETRTTAYAFYPTGLLSRVTREPDSQYYFLQRDLIRDGYGNVHVANETAYTNLGNGPLVTRTTVTNYAPLEEIFPISVVNTLGQTTYLDFDRRSGAPTLVADDNGIATQWAFDGFGRSAREVTPETESVTTYAEAFPSPEDVFFARAVLKSSTQTTGHGLEETAFDAFGRVVRRTMSGLTGALVASESQYDSAGRLSKTSRPHLANDTTQGVTQYVYDPAGRVSQVIPADPAREMLIDYATRATLAPADIGLATLPANYVAFTRTTAPNGGTDISVRDTRGEVVAARDAKGTWVTRDVGPFETTPKVTAAGAVTQNEFDRLGRVSKTIDPDRGTERYQYTAWNELDSYYIGTETAPRLKYAYDVLGRTRTITPSSGPSATYSYDADGIGGRNEIGRLVSTTSFDGSRRTFGYEAPSLTGNRGLLDHFTDTVDGIEMTTVLGYTALGQLDTMTYPGGSQPFVVQYCYDAAGFPSKIGRSNGGSAPCSNLADTYWELVQADQGQRPREERIGAMTALKGYFPHTGQLEVAATFTTAGNNYIQLETFDYDNNGNLQTRKTYSAPNALTTTETFTPDILGRLQSVQTDGAVSFAGSYTDDGNITGLTGAGTLTYDNPSNFPAHSPHTESGATFTYDALGGRRTATGTAIIGGTQTTTYDDLQQVKSIAFAGGPPPTTVDFRYQTTGERSKKSVTGGASVLYSGAYERTTSATGTIEHKYRVYSPNGPILEVSRDSSSSELSRAYLYSDLMGSPEVITDGDGTVLHRQKFGPYGATLSIPSWDSSNPAARRVTRGYTGHEHDPETGLVNMGARMYDARIGRFASPDFGVQVPGWAQAHNKYAYAWNNPYSWVDPFGLENEGTCEGMGAGECIPLDLGVITPNPTITYEQLQGLLEPDISQSYPNAHDVPLDVQSAYTRTPRESAFEEFERISDDRRTDQQKFDDLVDEALRDDPDAWRQLPSMRGLALLTGDDPATREVLLRERAYREALRISVGKPLAVAATVATMVIPEARVAEEGGETVLYRLITESDAEANFVSNAAKGLAPRGPEARDALLHRGLSMFDSLERAAGKVPILERGGKTVRGIAEIRIPTRATDVAVTKTLGPGHYTVTGAPGAVENLWKTSWTKW